MPDHPEPKPLGPSDDSHYAPMPWWFWAFVGGVLVLMLLSWVTT